MNKMRLRDSAQQLSARPLFRQYSMACLDRFFHYLPTCHRQWPYAATGQIPQSFVFVAYVKKDHAFACGCVIKRCAGIFRNQLKERLSPRSVRLIKDLFAKLLEFFNANCSDRFGDGFAPLLVGSFNVEEFFEWHRTG